MDSFEWNKVFAALLAMAFVVLGVTFLAEGIYHQKAPKVAGFAIEGGELEASETAATEGPAYDPISPLLASADIANGEKVAKKCVACHNFNDGGANKVGPVLWNVVNRQIAGVSDFGYSGALKEYADGKVWSYEELNGFLYKPKAHVKGTSMGYAGLKKSKDRANLIAYLRSLSATPAELPGS